MSVGDRIRARRNDLGLSQTDLAIALRSHGLPKAAQMTVSQWETGRRDPHTEELRAIAAALGVSAATLIDTASTGDAA